MNKFFLAAVFAAALVPLAAMAAPTAASLAAAEDQRFQDQINGRVAALADEVTDDLIYTHASGMEQTKAQFLHDAAMAGGQPKSMKATDRVVRIFGDVGYTHERFTIELGNGFKPTAISSGVYVFRHGHWMLDAWQTTEPRSAATGAK